MKIALRRASAAITAAAAALLCATSAAAQNAESADEALKKGDLADAKTQLEQAVKRNPADYNAAISYVSTLPPKDALRFADSLSRAPNAPVRVKAQSLRIVGDHHFLKEEYKKAADAYLQASKLDSAASVYKHLYALSIATDGQTEAARAVWNKIALDKTDELSGEAARILSLLPKPTTQTATEIPTINLQAAPPASRQPDTQPPPSAVPVNPPNNPPVPKATAAVKTDSVKTPPTISVTPSTPPPPPAPTAPAAQQNNAPPQTAAVNPQAAPANPNAPANPKPSEPSYTIQVGAFASKENADNLVKRLTGKYGDITVSTTGSGDQTLFRVRVGTFQKKEDAAAFADKLIIEAGLSARVMEK